MTSVATAGDTFSVFGTTATLVVSEPAAVRVARAVADAELAAVDQACSRFRPDSELARLNAAGDRAVAVSGLFAEILGVALRAARLTGGDVDPTCGGPLADIGYDRDFALLTAAGDTGPHRAGPHRLVPGWRSVQLDQSAGQVRLRGGAQLDLGATAKAWAADRCAAMIAAQTGSGVLVSLGGDIAVAGAPPDAGLADPGHRRSRRQPGRAWADGHHRVRRPGHLQHDGAHLGDGRPADASHHQPGHRPAGPLVLAHGQRGRGQLRRCQHGQHRGHRPQRRGTGVAAGGRPAGPAGPPRRVG